ncbi:MAG: hypothetical protein Q7S23_02100 [bacterium]|nr:hypothetical protein [bacterium]
MPIRKAKAPRSLFVRHKKLLADIQDRVSSELINATGAFDHHEELSALPRGDREALLREAIRREARDWLYSAPEDPPPVLRRKSV